MTGVADSIIQVIATSLQLKAPKSPAPWSCWRAATVPFIARYRKEITGALDEDQIRTIQERYAYASELEARKITVLRRSRPQVSSRLSCAPHTQCSTKQELEDLYQPYRPNAALRPASPATRDWSR
jgi:uncharacterized protein